MAVCDFKQWPPLIKNVEKRRSLGTVIQPPLGMSKNGGPGCDGYPYLVMSQTVSAREHGITTVQARPPSYYLSICLQLLRCNRLFSFLSCHLNLSWNFICALFLLSVFVPSLYSPLFVFLTFPPHLHLFILFNQTRQLAGLRSYKVFLQPIRECFIKHELCCV